MEKVKMYAEDAVIIDNKIYCIGSKMSVLFSVNMENGDIKIIDRLPNEKLFLNQSSRRIISWNGNLVFVPYGATAIHMYNIADATWKNFDFVYESNYGNKYLEALLYNDKIIMIGAEEKNILEFNLNTYEVKIVNSYFKEYKNPQEIFCRSGYVILNGYLYIAVAINNEILKINLSNWESETIRVGEDGSGFSGIAYDGDNFWLTPRRDGDIIIWDGKEKTEKYKLPFELIKGKCNFGGIFTDAQNLYLHGFEGKYSAIINKKTKKIDYNENQFVFLRDLNKEIILGQLKNSQILVYDVGKMNLFSCEIEKERISDFYFSKVNNVKNSDLKCQNESGYFNLYDYFKYIKRKE